MRSIPTGLFLLLAFLARNTSAQMATTAGTTLAIDAGTSLRVETPLTWSIADGATVVNNGTIVLGPEADLQEALGAPITGGGTERTTRTLAGPLNVEAPGGLGLAITTDAALGTTTVVRGHLSHTDTSDAVSIARWYRVLPANNSGLNAMLGFGYDATELNGITELGQVVHIATSGDTVWSPLSSSVLPVASTVNAGPVDSLGHFTTFEGEVPMDIGAAHAAGALPYLVPTVATDRVFLHLPEGMRISRIEVIAMDGRMLQRITGDLHAQAGGTPIDIDRLPPGRYVLRLDGRTTLDLIKR